jgi:hypothetical protein
MSWPAQKKNLLHVSLQSLSLDILVLVRALTAPLATVHAAAVVVRGVSLAVIRLCATRLILLQK